METILYLIRHAQSQPKTSQHYSKWRLSSKGVRQSKQLTELLEPLGIQMIFSSPFARCLDTIRPFAIKRRIQIAVVDELRERLVAKEITDGFYDIWCKSWDDFDFALPGCETSIEAQDRFVAAVNDITDEHDKSPMAISTHGNVIGLFLNWTDKKLGRKETEALKNPDVVRIVRRDGTFFWDRSFRLPGLEDIATDHEETAVERDD